MRSTNNLCFLNNTKKNLSINANYQGFEIEENILSTTVHMGHRDNKSINDMYIYIYLYITIKLNIQEYNNTFRAD